MDKFRVYLNGEPQWVDAEGALLILRNCTLPRYPTEQNAQHLIPFKLHREDGPALIWPDGSEHYYINGRKHRTNGPAVIGADGTVKWFYNNVFYSKSIFLKEMIELGNLTKEEAVLLALQYP